MSAAPDARGLKRICADCGTRYYDMNKRPVICPSCGAEFALEPKIKTRRGRVAANDADNAKNKEAEVSATEEAQPEEGEIEASEDLSLDEVETLEEGDDDEALGDIDPDMDADFEDDLETDLEGDDDVALDVDISEADDD